MFHNRKRSKIIYMVIMRMNLTSLASVKRSALLRIVYQPPAHIHSCTGTLTNMLLYFSTIYGHLHNWLLEKKKSENGILNACRDHASVKINSFLLLFLLHLLTLLSHSIYKTHTHSLVSCSSYTVHAKCTLYELSPLK